MLPRRQTVFRCGFIHVAATRIEFIVSSLRSQFLSIDPHSSSTKKKVWDDLSQPGNQIVSTGFKLASILQHYLTATGSRPRTEYAAFLGSEVGVTMKHLLSFLLVVGALSFLSVEAEGQGYRNAKLRSGYRNIQSGSPGYNIRSTSGYRHQPGYKHIRSSPAYRSQGNRTYWQVKSERLRRQSRRR